MNITLRPRWNALTFVEEDARDDACCRTWSGRRRNERVRQCSGVAIARMPQLHRRIADSATQSQLTFTTSSGLNVVRYSALPSEPDIALERIEGCCGLLCGGRGELMVRPMPIAERNGIKR